MQKISSKSAGATYRFGKALGKLLEPGDLVAFTGDLGAGKTCCIQGIADGLGIQDRSIVTSPTFTLIQEYQGKIPMYHFDVYRFAHEDEIHDLGYEEYFYGEGVTVIEWAERITAFLPTEYLAIHLHVETDQTRCIQLCAYGKRYEDMLQSLPT